MGVRGAPIHFADCAPIGIGGELFADSALILYSFWVKGGGTASCRVGWR